MTKTKNAKGRPFSWSYSAYADFQNCPARYAAARFYCTTPWRDTDAIRWGNKVHHAAEMTLRGMPEKADPEAFKPVKPYVNAMLNSGHKVEAELEIALTKKFKPTSWFSHEAWLRAKLDVVITQDHKVSLYDWKTGKTIRDSPDQLNLCAAALSVIRPEIELFEGKFVWTAHKQITGIKPLRKEEIKDVWAEFLPAAQRMEDAWDSDHFPARPSGLCPWCPVDGCHKRRGSKRV